MAYDYSNRITETPQEAQACMLQRLEELDKQLSTMASGNVRAVLVPLDAVPITPQMADELIECKEYRDFAMRMVSRSFDLPSTMFPDNTDATNYSGIPKISTKRLT